MNPSIAQSRSGLVFGDSQWRALFERLDTPIYQLDSRGTIEWCNAAATRLMGYAPRYSLGRLIWETLSLETRTGESLKQDNFPLLGSSPDLRLPPEIDLILNHPADGLRPLSLTATPVADSIHTHGHFQGILVILGLRWCEEAVEDADRSDLISTVSHEMRSPITSILGLTGLMLTHEVPDEKVRKYIDVIHQDATRLRALVEDLLDYERVRSRRQVFRLGPLSLAEAVEKVVSDFASTQATHRMLVDVRADLSRVQAKPEVLTRVLDNLLSNAVKYSPGGGTVSIRARAQGQEVTVSVCDQGRGFDPCESERLFRKFYRLQVPNSADTRGSGLGLAIVKEIVQSLGGQVWARSDGPGLGSVFEFTLGLAEPEAWPGPASSLKADEGELA